MFLLPLSIIVGMMLYYVWQLNGSHQVLGLGSICLCFYLALIMSIAIPFSAQRSAKGLGELLVKDGIREVGLYGSYPTSAVFYSNASIVKLVPEKELERYKPKNMSWSSKNVMPFAAMEKQHYPFVIVNEKSMKDFLKQNKHQWQLAGRSGRYLLLSPQVEQGRMDDSLLACYNSDVRARLTVKNEWRNQHGRT